MHEQQPATNTEIIGDAATDDSQNTLPFGAGDWPVIGSVRCTVPHRIIAEAPEVAGNRNHRALTFSSKGCVASFFD